jgi:microcystin-dependent protein
MDAWFIGNVIGFKGSLIGEIKAYAGLTTPSGWLECDGSAISRETYAELFDTIGTIWGAGDGSTTFNLPNLKGKVPVGYDASQTEFDTVGETGGASTVTLDTTMIPAHTHGSKSLSGQFHALAYKNGQASNGIITRNSNTANVNSTSSGSKWGTVYYTVNATHTHDSVGGGQAHNNLQPYAVVKYIICAI